MKIRFKYTKNHTYRCTRCSKEFSELPEYCPDCAWELATPDEHGNLSQEYYDLFGAE